MLPHNTSACLDEFLFEFETRKCSHDFARFSFFDQRKIGTQDIRTGSNSDQRNFRLLKLSNGRRVHRDPIPHDRGSILRQSVLSQKLAGGLRSLNLKWQIADKLFG